MVDSRPARAVLLRSGPSEAIGPGAGVDQPLNRPVGDTNNRNLVAGVAGDVGGGTIGRYENFLGNRRDVDGMDNLHRLEVDDRYLVAGAQCNNERATVGGGSG